MDNSNKPNPILDQLSEDPFQYQRKQVDDAKAELIDLQRRCFEIFHMLKDGRELYDILLRKFIIPAKFAPSDRNAAKLALYWEGFKEAMRGLHDMGAVHAKRINEGGKR